MSPEEEATPEGKWVVVSGYGGVMAGWPESQPGLPGDLLFPLGIHEAFGLGVHWATGNS